MSDAGRGRRLSPEESDLWNRVARTVRPLEPVRRKPLAIDAHSAKSPATPAPTQLAPPAPARRVRGRVPPAPAMPSPPPAPPRPLDRHGLDASWDRKLVKGTVSPDFTLDLHGASLDAAHARLDHGLAQALAHGARVMLLITGRARTGQDRAAQEGADRHNRRGVIRAKFLDWVTAGPYASQIAAIRPAHPRHGGAGAVYIVLRRPK